MVGKRSSPGSSLLAAWRRLSPWPGGRWLFGLILRTTVPYSGSIRPRILALEPGRAAIALRDRRRVRNHLASIHAIALANLGELATGLAVVTALPSNVRGIVTRIEVTYNKKARGRLIAECWCQPPRVSRDDVEYDATTDIRDANQDPVCEVRARWRLSPTGPPVGTAPDSGR